MYRVIIVDDEPKVSQLIKNLIDWNTLNLEYVATAHDGFTAFELIKKHNPDIVITDIRMPGYDGIELIKHAKNFNPKIDFIIISGYQHFDYAYNAIKYGVKDYFLKPLKRDEINSTLLKMIKKYSQDYKLKTHYHDNVKKLKDELLRAIYFGSSNASINEEKLYKLVQDEKVYFAEGCFQALIFKPDFDYEVGDKEVTHILIDKISRIIIQNLSNVCFEFLWISVENSIFLIANFRNEDKKSLRRALHNIISESLLLRDFIKNLTLSIGLGSVQTSIIKIEASAKEAKQALFDRIVTGGGLCQFNSKLHGQNVRESIVTFEKRQKLLVLLDIFDVDGIQKWIDNIENDVLKLSDISGQFVIDTVNEIMEIILFCLKNYVKTREIDKTDMDEFAVAIHMQNSIRGIFKMLRRYAVSMIQQLAEDFINEISRPIREAKRYINEHYASDIDLERISAIVGYNATYFSTLFKKETGTNFLEYVTSVRVRAAKQLLCDPKKTVLSICNEVGYSDLSHFVKQFKKTTGLTPSEYRKFHY